MNLFDILPERLFNVLSSPSKALYAHVLFLLYDLYKQSLYGIEREAVLDQITAFLDTETVDLTADDLEGADTGALSPREKAGAILRRLQATGWLEVETRTNYDQYVNLRDYAIKVLDTLDAIRTQRQTEYAGYVLATMHLLTSPEAGQNPGLSIDKAYDQTGQLIRDLKSLHQNIKVYTERMLRQKEPKEILELHFGEYQQEVLDKAYHRLKTSDNVSKYRPKILARIDEWLSDPDWLRDAAAGEVRRGRQPSAEAAEELLRMRLGEIRTSYEQMDRLIDEIDRRNAQYAKASLDQIRYLLNAGRDTASQLVDLLKVVVSEVKSGSLPADGTWPADRAGLFALFNVQPWTGETLYKPRRFRRKVQPQPLMVDEVSVAEREAGRERARARLAAKLTPVRISEFVLERLGERQEASAADLGIESTWDYIRLIYTAAYSRDNRVKYRVDWQAPAERVESGEKGFTYRNLRIRRKQEGKR